MEVSGQRHAPATLCPSPHPLGKEPRYPLNRSLDGTQSGSGRFGEQKNLLPLPAIEPRIVHYAKPLSGPTVLS